MKAIPARLSKEDSAPMSDKTALYPGTFDCLTYGHLNLIERCARVFDRLIVAVAVNSAKKPLFTLEERIEMLREAVKDWPNVEVAHFEGLTVHYAKAQGVRFIIRGLRAVTDFESELELALMNQRIAPEVETLFMTPTIGYVFVSSSLTKEVLSGGGNVSTLVPPHVERELRRKLL
ncbi:pantetheine-phosphate adenylyltransferase [Candidatus Sumerlaeota bacterium]|nr:pantetheine-phosphate adenylyltransferase [Candidatus Sumerlaeota bacterium]